MIMVYLYSVAGYAYLHDGFLKTGKVPAGAEIAVQMATVAGGVLGPMAGWLMLLFIMVTLYDAQFPIYDTFIGRTTTDAIAATRMQQGRVNHFFHNLLPVGLRNRPYRFWYFVVVTVAVGAGFWMVLASKLVHDRDRRPADRPLPRQGCTPRAANWVAGTRRVISIRKVGGLHHRYVRRAPLIQLNRFATIWPVLASGGSPPHLELHLFPWWVRPQAAGHPASDPLSPSLLAFRTTRLGLDTLPCRESMGRRQPSGVRSWRRTLRGEDGDNEARSHRRRARLPSWRDLA
jgi:hypothetical protein